MMKFNILQAFFRRKPWLLYIGFLLIFLTDVTYAFRRLVFLNAGGDSQWYGAKLLWSGTNPYTASLESSEWFMTAYPNYAHILYIVLFPLTLFDWETSKIIWFLFNIFCFLATLYLFVYRVHVSLQKVLLLGIVLLLGSTFTNSLYQGQISIVILALVSFAWVFRKNSVLLILFLALIFSKYSFGLPILFGFFLAGYRKESIGAFAINVFCAIVFSFLFDIGIIESLKQPLEVASTFTSGHGHSDILTLFRLTNPDETIFGLNYFSISVGILYLIYIYICYVYKPNEKSIIVSSILLSFAVLFHLDYDYVVLLSAILISLSTVRLTKRNLVLLVSIASYFWLYPVIPKLMRVFFNIDLGIHPFEWFDLTFGIVFIVFNIVLILVTVFLILLDKGPNKFRLSEKKLKLK